MNKTEFKKLDRAVESAGNRFDKNPTVVNEIKLKIALLKREIAFNQMKKAA